MKHWMRNCRKPSLPENKGFKAELGVRGGREQFYRQLDHHINKLKGAPNPKDFGFGNFFNAAKFYPKSAPYDKHYVVYPIVIQEPGCS